VAQLLLFAQGQPPRREPTDMGRLLAQLSRNHAEAFARKGIRLISRIEPGLPPVKGDEQQLIQACEGLLEDAEAGLRSGGEIEISCQRAEGGVEVTLVDNGRPIPPERLAKVFQPFQQGRATNGHRVPLSASYGIIRSHGGRVRVQSDESLGTRFSVWLPCE
jgi:two-component system NtrC family sensor kinase